jgi:hypothetical protein
MENQHNKIIMEEEKNAQTIQQAILDMHSQIGLEEEETDQENDER